MSNLWLQIKITEVLLDAEQPGWMVIEDDGVVFTWNVFMEEFLVCLVSRLTLISDPEEYVKDYLIEGEISGVPLKPLVVGDFKVLEHSGYYHFSYLGGDWLTKSELLKLLLKVGGEYQ